MNQRDTARWGCMTILKVCRLLPLITISLCVHFRQCEKFINVIYFIVLYSILHRDRFIEVTAVFISRFQSQCPSVQLEPHTSQWGWGGGPTHRPQEQFSAHGPEESCAVWNLPLSVGVSVKKSSEFYKPFWIFWKKPFVHHLLVIPLKVWPAANGG